MFTSLKNFFRRRRLDEFHADLNWADSHPHPFSAEGGQVCVEYLAGSAELRELYLWQTPFRFPHDEDFWIIGGSIEDPAVMICAKSGNEGVYAVRSYLTVDEVDFAELEPSLNAFLAKLKAA